MNTSRDDFDLPRWVDRLLRGEAGALREKERQWWGIWILRFLKFCREDTTHTDQDLVPVAKGYLKSLKGDPAVEDWQWEQAREALRVFARGTENWHWKQGRPAFRKKGVPDKSTCFAIFFRKKQSFFQSNSNISR